MKLSFKTIKLKKFNKEISIISILNLLIKFFFFSAIVFFPLIFSIFQNLSNIFELPKITFLKVYLIIIFFLFVLREIKQISPIWKNFKDIFKKYYLFPFLFILIFFISILFSSDISLSFFGKIDRQQGLLSYILYFVWFLLFSFELIRSKMMKQKNNINIYFFAFIISAFIASVYGILQYLGIDFLNWSEKAYLTKRSFSTLGQPNFFASWLLLVLPLPLFLLKKVKEKYLRIFLFISFIVILLAIFTTGSRAAWLSILFLLFLLYIFLLRSQLFSWKKKIIASVFIVLFSALSLFSIEFMMPGRITQMLNLKTGSTSARIDFYKAGIDAIIEKPLVGYGQENVQEKYVSYYTSNWGIHSDVNQVPDRAHNLILDILLSGGIILFIAFLFLYFDFFRKSYYLCFKDKKNYLICALSLGVIAYLFSLLFGFSIPSGEFYFFSYLAIISYYLFIEDYREYKEINFIKESVKKIYKIIIAIFLTIVCSILIYFSLTPLLADYYFTKAIKNYAQGELGEMTILLDYSEELPNNRAWRSFYAQKYAKLIYDIYPTNELVVDFFLKQKLEDADNYLYGDNFRNLTSKVLVNMSLNKFEVGQAYLDKLIKVSSSLPQSNILAANYYTNIFEYEKALNYLEKNLTLLPDINSPYINEDHKRIARNNFYNTYLSIASVYDKMKEYDKAIENYRIAYSYNPQDYLIFKKIADIYYLNREFDKAIIEVEKGMRLSPDDHVWPLLLHYIYEEIENKEKSLYWLEEARLKGFVDN